MHFIICPVYSILLQGSVGFGLEKTINFLGTFVFSRDLVLNRNYAIHSEDNRKSNL